MSISGSDNNNRFLQNSQDSRNVQNSWNSRDSIATNDDFVSLNADAPPIDMDEDRISSASLHNSNNNNYYNNNSNNMFTSGMHYFGMSGNHYALPNPIPAPMNHLPTMNYGVPPQHFGTSNNM